MKAIALQSTSDSGPAGKQRKAEVHAVPISPWFIQPASVLDGPVVQRKPACACGGGCPGCMKDLDDLHVQTKLAISTPGDQYEQEADRVTEQVTRRPDTAREPMRVSRLSPPTQLWRACSACEEGKKTRHQTADEDEVADVQPKSLQGGGKMTHSAEAAVRSLRGGGQPLSDATRSYFEPRFGHDFSRVRVHADSEAATAASAVSARAYTLGRDIVFGAGEYAPATVEGTRLLAHELVHVVQQGEQNHHVVQRDPLDPDSGQPEEPPLTRPQEIALSRSSPGEVTGQPQPLTLSLFNFGIDVARPKTEHRAVLVELGRFLHATTAMPTIVRSIGFADSTGDERHNLDLSRRRSEAVKAILQPLITQRVTISAHGETNPAGTNETVAGRSRNRRVDIRFFVDRPVPPQPLPRPRPVPPGRQPPPGTQPPGTQPPGTEPPGGTRDDRSFCEDYPLLCLLGPVPFFLPLICLIAPEVCLAAVCALAPELCIIPPPLPPKPPDQPPPEEDDGRPIVRFVPAVRSPNTPAGMNDRIGLRDPVHVMAVVVNPPALTAPITIAVDGTGPNGGVATINASAQIQINGTTALEVLGTLMTAENYAFSPFLQLAAWWANDLVGESNRFAVSSIAENWSAVFAGANRGRFGWVFKADMPWDSDSGSHSDLDACQYVELVAVGEENGGMTGMGVGEVDDPNDPNTADLSPAFDQHGTPFEYTRVAGYSRLKQLWRIRDRRSNSDWAPSSNSGFEIERQFERDPANPRCWHLIVRKKGASVDINGMRAAAGAGDISHEFRDINCDPPPPPQPGPEDPQPTHEDPQPTPEPTPTPTPSETPPCDREELARRVDQCIEQAKHDAIDCGLGLIPFSGGWGGVAGGIDFYLCLDEMREALLRCDRRAKADTHCPDSPPPTPPDPRRTT